LFKYWRLRQKTSQILTNRGRKSGVMQRIMSIFLTKSGRNWAVLWQANNFKHALNCIFKLIHPYDFHMTTRERHDFLVQHQFSKHVLAPNEQSEVFWAEWMAQSPENKTAAQEMQDLVQSLHPEQKLDAQNKAQMWANIQQGLEGLELELEEVPMRRLNWFRYAAAAVLALAILSGLGLWFKGAGTVEVLTAYGETKNVTLPDGSTVVLNSHSSLTYSSKGFDQRDREVVLNGEAFFSVVKKAGLRFTVRTKQANVEVLGTRFNVNSRREQTSVFLQSGKVALTNTQAQTTKPTVLQPGDLAEVEAGNKSIRVNQTQSKLHTSWVNRKLVFDNSTLREIGQVIEDTYGLKVRIDDEQLAKELVTGEIPIAEKSTLFKALESLYGLTIEESNQDSISIKRN
jgi:transmembrane sensor